MPWARAAAVAAATPRVDSSSPALRRAFLARPTPVSHQCDDVPLLRPFADTLFYRDRQPDRPRRPRRQVRRQDQQVRRRPDQQPDPRRCWQQCRWQQRRTRWPWKVKDSCGYLRPDTRMNTVDYQCNEFIFKLYVIMYSTTSA